MIPFENSIDTFDLRGDHLKTVFECAVKHSWSTTVFDGKYFIQVSGKIISSIQIVKRTVSIQSNFSLFDRIESGVQHEK